MGRFIVTLTDEEQATLEAKRAQLGLRSKADVIRYWIGAEAAPKPSPVSRGKLDTVTERVSFGPVDPITGERLEPRKPMQKGPKK